MKARITRYSGEYVGLAWNFEVNPSSCANADHYQNYLRLIAADDMKTGEAVTHIFLIEHEDDSKEIGGFISLRASSYIVRSEGVSRGTGALEILELAVAKEHEGQDIGTLLAEYAITVANDLKEEAIGIKYVTLCADEQAVGFYEKLGFKKLSIIAELPRNGANDNCTPMILKLPE